jgi:hypothetical protein
MKIDQLVLAEWKSQRPKVYKVIQIKAIFQFCKSEYSERPIILNHCASMYQYDLTI